MKRRNFFSTIVGSFVAALFQRKPTMTTIELYRYMKKKWLAEKNVVKVWVVTPDEMPFQHFHGNVVKAKRGVRLDNDL